MSATEDINEAAKHHAATNGVITIGLPRRGLAQIKFNEDDVPFMVDVIQVYDEWAAADDAFRDKDGKLLDGKFGEWKQAQHNFVQGVINSAYGAVRQANPDKEVRVPQVSRAEAEAFMTQVGIQTKELRDFFSPRGARPSSSSESTEPEQRINFSQ